MPENEENQEVNSPANQPVQPENDEPGVPEGSSEEEVPSQSTPDLEQDQESESQELSQLREDLLKQITEEQPSSGSGFQLPDIQFGKWALGAFSVLLLAVTAWLGWNFYQGQRGEIVINVQPSDAQVRIDGEERNVRGGELRASLPTGTYSLEVTKSGFRDFEREFEIEAQEATQISVRLRGVPEINDVISEGARFVDVSGDGKSTAYFDTNSSQFIRANLEDEEQRALFGGRTFDGIAQVNWSPSLREAIVKIEGVPNLRNMRDHTEVPGEFLAGERPEQKPPLFNGRSNWLFDTTRNTADGWQPIRLTDSIREVGFSPLGERILYRYSTQDGENSLVIANPDGREWKRLLSQGIAGLNMNEMVWSESSRFVLLKVGEDQSQRWLLFDQVSESIRDFDEEISGTYAPHWVDSGSELWLHNGDEIRRWSAMERQFLEPIELDENLREIVASSAESGYGLDENENLWEFDLSGELNPVSYIGDSELLSEAKLHYLDTLRYLIGVSPEGQIVYLAL